MNTQVLPLIPLIGRNEESVPTVDKKKKTAKQRTPSREGSQEAYDSAPEEQGAEGRDSSKEEAEESGNDSEASGSVRRSERAEAKKDRDYTGKSAKVNNTKIDSSKQMYLYYLVAIPNLCII